MSGAAWEYFDDPRPDVQALLSVAGRRVLDVGCGNGALGAALKHAGAAEVWGVESQPPAAAAARARLDGVVEGDLLQVALPFPPGHFDYLVLADVLEHVAEPEKALARYLPLLAAAGRVVASVPNMRFYTVLLRLLFDRWRYSDSGVRDRTHLRVFTRRSFLDLLRGAGLEVERLERNYRLFEDQSRQGRWGALLSRLIRRGVAPWLAPDLLAYQYLALARRREG